MIGSRIKLARETVGLTQTELAERIGTTQSGVASMEANVYRPSAEYLETIARETGFGVGLLQAVGRSTSSLPERSCTGLAPHSRRTRGNMPMG